MKMKKLSAAALSFILCLLMTSCAPKENESAYIEPVLLPAAGVASDIAEVIRDDHYTLSMRDASVTAYVEELCFTVDGVIDEINVLVGDSVKKGDVLVTLDLEDERKQYEKLLETIERTRKSNEYANKLLEIEISILEVERQSLISKGADKNRLAINENDLLQAKLNLNQAKELQSVSLEALLQDAKQYEAQLANDRIVAPFDGVISRAIEVSRGSGVKAYDTVLCLADNSRIGITTKYISETTVNAAHEVYALIGDSRYEIEYVQMDQKEYLAKVLIGEEVYTSFTITGPGDWQSRVEAGEYAAVMFVNSYVPDVLLIPANAVLSDSDGKYVYIVGENGERIKRTIRIRNFANSIYTQVTEGLEEGERIYVTDK